MGLSWRINTAIKIKYIVSKICKSRNPSKTMSSKIVSSVAEETAKRVENCAFRKPDEQGGAR